MNRFIDIAFAAAMIIAFATPLQAVAQSPPEEDTAQDTSTPEDSTSENSTAESSADDEFIAGSEAEPQEGEDSDATASKEYAETSEEDANDGQAQPNPPERRKFRDELKHALLGALLPVVERRIRKASGEDAEQTNSESTTESEP